ncbi:retrovirus-related pol polyprotein from transposon TNT 1-94 [Tanacetum coccineum]
MDLCCPMRVKSINRKWYVLVIVDDYSRYTWVHFLRSKNEALEEIKTFLKKITSILQAQVIIVRIDNGHLEFNIKCLKESLTVFGILTKHLLIFGRSLEQRSILAFSLVILLIVVLSSIQSRRQRKSWMMIEVTLIELSAIAFEQRSSKLGLQSMTSRQITMYDDYMGGQQSKAQRTAPANQNLLTPNASTTVEESAPTPTNSLQFTNIPNTSQDVDELPQQQHVQ